MRRVRIVALLLAVALLVPTALLVRRTLQGVAAEKASRHRAVAERVFDEMERSLSEFLAREDARPASDYRFEPGSPLGTPASQPFVVGHFEIGADGRVRTAPAANGRVEAVVARHLAARREGQELPAAEAEKQVPGTTVSQLDQLRALGYVTGSEDFEAKDEADAAPRSDRAYSALQSLNRGALERSERARKAVEEPVAPAESAESGVARAAAPPSPPFAESRQGPGREAEGPAEPGLRKQARSAGGSEVAVDPLHGVVVDREHLLLSRTAWTGERGTRQGLVLDRVALADWLRRQVFAPLALPGAALSFVGESDAPAAGQGAFVYRHRFAEPFEGATAVLALSPLAEVPGERTVWALALLLAAVGTAGLFAIYRTTAVTVAFAERRSNFVAAVTHELKTPLTAIRMYGEMLRDGLVQGEGKRQEYYRTITAESERLGRLIDNVLEFSRLERGTRAMNLVSGDLGAVVDELAGRVRPHAETGGFALDVEIAPDLPLVRFERDALLQMLFNLVDNAVKYAGASAERRIHIGCAPDPERRGRVLLRVRDHGPGVPARHLSRIFEPFYRGEDELTRRTQGTGLGLALVKGLAERMGAVAAGANASGGGFEVCIAFAALPG